MSEWQWDFIKAFSISALCLMVVGLVVVASYWLPWLLLVMVPVLFCTAIGFIYASR